MTAVRIGAMTTGTTAGTTGAMTDVANSGAARATTGGMVRMDVARLLSRIGDGLVMER
jgi:hypothetical protein